MNIKTIISREMDQNCYLIEKDGKGILIDPGLCYDKIIKEIQGIEVNYILLTHCHFDHLYSLNKLRGQKLVVGSHECSSNMITPKISLCDFTSLPETSCDIEMEDNEEKNFGGIKVKCIKTPGHTTCSVCYMIGDCLFSGDTLFGLSIGRSDLPTGDYKTLEKSIKEKLYTLGDDIKVYPGHGAFTTIGHEKKNNPFVRE